MKSVSQKIQAFSRVTSFVKKAKTQNKTIVTTNGCFDILHTGHVRYLEFAKRRGDILIVGINSNASVRKNKGPTRPINDARDRAELVASLSSVDMVFIFPHRTPDTWLKQIQPHIHVKGGDYGHDQIKERQVVESGGGKVVLAPHTRHHSSTHVVKKILKNHASKPSRT